MLQRKDIWLRGLPTFLGVALASAAAYGSSLSYDGFESPANLLVQGAATVMVDRVRLTPNVPSQAGALWYGTKQFVQNGFETSFQFQITNPTGRGADGLAFVIQNGDAPRLGQKGGNLGFGGITNAVAIKFDNYHYGGAPDQSGRGQILKFDEVGVQASGAGKVLLVSNYHPDLDSIASMTNGPTFSNGKVHTVKIVYTPGNLQLILDDFRRPLLTAAVDLSKLMDLDNGRAWIGFTAATGADSQNQDLISWSFVSADDQGRGSATTVPTSSVTLNWPTFRTSRGGESVPTELLLQGDAVLLRDRVRITPSVRSQAGGLWQAHKRLVKDGFETTIQFQITEPRVVGGNGFAFVLQNGDAPQLGAKGGYGGFSGITNAVAVKFTNYHYVRQGTNWVYAKFDEISVQTGRTPSEGLDSYRSRKIASATNGFTFADGRVHTAKIAYGAGRLHVYLDAFSDPLLTAEVDLGKVMDLDHDSAWVGFTASTGADSQNNDLLAWSLVSLGSAIHPETNATTTPTQMTLADKASAAPRATSPAQFANTGSTPVPSTAPDGESTGTPELAVVVSPATVLGTWETTIRGADEGMMILTFANDFTLQGYGVRTGMTNLFLITGNWGNDNRGTVAGRWRENGGGVNSAEGTFSVLSFTGPVLVAAANSSNGRVFSWTGRRATSYSDLGGTWELTISGTAPAGVLRRQFLPFTTETATYPGVFEIDGDGPGILMISSSDQVYGSLQLPSVGRASFRGWFSPVTLTLSLHGVQEDGTEFNAAARKE